MKVYRTDEIRNVVLLGHGGSGKTSLAAVSYTHLTGKSLDQATDIVGNLITDIHLMLTDGDEKDMTFLYRVK